jgi:hypothetical protein
MPNQTDSKIRFQLSTGQLKAVATMLEDQLFRVKFIDPKLPGHKRNPEQLHDAESALEILKGSLQTARTAAPDLPSRIVRKSS